MEYLKLLGLRLLGKFRKTYFMALPENQQDLLRSRKLYTTGDSAAQTIVNITAGTFLVSLTGRFVFGKKSSLGCAVSTAFAILFVYPPIGLHS